MIECTQQYPHSILFISTFPVSQLSAVQILKDIAATTLFWRSTWVKTRRGPVYPVAGGFPQPRQPGVRLVHMCSTRRIHICKAHIQYVYIYAQCIYMYIYTYAQ